MSHPSSEPASLTTPPPPLDWRNILLALAITAECLYGMSTETSVAEMMSWFVIGTAIVFNVLRRTPALSKDDRWWVGVICFCSVLRFLAFRVPPEDREIWYLRILLEVLGDLCLLYLGRSFAILPARRKIQTGFLYRFVRHPIYTTYIIGDVIFVCFVPNWWNACVLVIGIGLFIARAHLEEEVLREDPIYAEFMKQTRWRFFPGLH